MVRISLYLLLGLSTLSFNSWDGGLSTLTKIEIYEGLTIYGTKSFKLTEEGLLYRESWDKKVLKFVPLKKLNFNKLKKMQTFIINNNYLADVDTLLTKEYIGIGKSPTVFIIRKDNYKSIRIIKDYIGNNPKLDSLKFYMNELIK